MIPLRLVACCALVGLAGQLRTDSPPTAPVAPDLSQRARDRACTAQLAPVLFLMDILEVGAAPGPPQ